MTTPKVEDAFKHISEWKAFLWVVWNLHGYIPTPSEEESEAISTLFDLFRRIFGPPPKDWNEVETLHQLLKEGWGKEV